MLNPGTHINAIGAFRPDMCEIPPETVKNSLVVVDQLEACKNEAGDLIQPIQNGIIPDDHINLELGEIILQPNKGRKSEEQVTFFKSVGVAAQDLAMASLIYKKAISLGIGQEVYF